jgi:hypothetical protein
MATSAGQTFWRAESRPPGGHDNKNRNSLNCKDMISTIIADAIGITIGSNEQPF